MYWLVGLGASLVAFGVSPGGALLATADHGPALSADAAGVGHGRYLTAAPGASGDGTPRRRRARPASGQPS